MVNFEAIGPSDAQATSAYSSQGNIVFPFKHKSMWLSALMQ